jgi:vomeronasal 2 receptor
MSLACMAVFFSALTVVSLGDMAKYQDTLIVKASNWALRYILLNSLACCFLCVLLFISHPHTVTCILQQTTFRVVFTVAVIIVLGKTVIGLLSVIVTSPGRRMRRCLFVGDPKFIIPICTLIQLILCGIWLGTCPPLIDIDTHFEHGHIIIVCNKASVTAFYCDVDTWFLGSGELHCGFPAKEPA